MQVDQLVDQLASQQVRHRWCPMKEMQRMMMSQRHLPVRNLAQW